MHTPLKAVIWDMDGTLLNTLEDISGALNQALRSWGLPEHSPYETLEGIGHGARYLCHWASGLEGEELDRFAAEYRSNAVHLSEPKTQPYPGIIEVLRHLKECGIKLGIYTNKPQRWTEQLVDRFFGQSLFDCIIGTTPDGWLKPDAGGIAHMCERWHLSEHEVVMVGDSEVDWQTARNAGCRAICVSWGFGDVGKLRQQGAMIVDSMQDLSKMLSV